MSFLSTKRCVPYGESDYSRVDITIHVLDIAVKSALVKKDPGAIVRYLQIVLDEVLRELEDPPNATPSYFRGSM